MVNAAPNHSNGICNQQLPHRPRKVWTVNTTMVSSSLDRRLLAPVRRLRQERVRQQAGIAHQRRARLRTWLGSWGAICPATSGLAMGLLLMGIGAGQAEDYAYETLDGTVTITWYRGWDAEVHVPDNIEGLPVVRIGDSAFKNRHIISVSIPDTVTSLGDRVFHSCRLLTDVFLNHGLTSIGAEAYAECSSLTRITIPDSVTRIGERTFHGCTSLTSVVIGNSVTSIGSEAFMGCTSLTSIDIPDSVASIDRSAFFWCRSLTNIEVGALNPAYSSLQGVLFNKTQDELISYPGGKVGSYTIPYSVISIGERAFFACEGLSDVTIPDGVTSIGEGAFQGCKGLSSITIPHSVTTIAAWTFSGVSLTSVTIGKGVTSIGDYAIDLGERTKVYFHGGLPSFGRGVFDNYGKPTLYYLPSGAVWGSNWGAPVYGVIPTVLWNPLLEVRGIQDGELLLHLRGAINIPVLVEASTEVSGVEWISLHSGVLTNGSLEIPDPDWGGHATRFYRVRSP